jgi:hypothetical protein
LQGAALFLEKAVRGLVVVLFAFMLLEGLSWLTATIPPCLIQTTDKEQAAHHYNEKDCPTFLPGSLILLGRADHFIESDDKSIVAGFTIVLAFSTIGLWLATVGLQRSTNRLWDAGERQLKLTRKTSRRQLRAYIHVTRVEVRDFLNIAEYFIQYENRGQTPAYKIEVSNCIALETVPVRSDLFDRQLEFSRHGALGPGGQTHFKKPGPRQLTAAELADLANGSLAVWVFGKIRYVDAFGKSHTTTYRNLITRDAPLSSDGKMGMAEQGNDAN